MFPSPIGVIFFLIKIMIKFRKGKLEIKFPSPIGVIFFLIYIKALGLDLELEFPSPIGVIFFLILYSKKLLFAIFYKAIIV